MITLTIYDHENSRHRELVYHAGLSELLSEDLSAWEFYNSLPEKYRQRLRDNDVNSFTDMQELVSRLRSREPHP